MPDFVLSSLLRHSLPTLAIVLLGACATAGSYAPRPLSGPDDLSGVQTKSVDDITVSVAILTDEQARQHFGTDLSKENLQALWMSVVNRSSEQLWFIKNTLDRDFYTADEAAIMVKSEVPDKAFESLRQYFRDETIRVSMTPASVTEGFVFLPRQEGGRYVDVRLTGDAYTVDRLKSGSKTGGPQDVDFTIRELRFGFALPLPDGDFDYERLDPANTYAGKELPDLGLQDLRQALEQLPCCVMDDDGESMADPLNVVMVADSTDLLTSLSRSGWSFTHRISLHSVERVIGSSLKGEAYPVAPVSSLYLFGRKQDFALQRARNSIAQRNHMRFWLAPFTYEKKQVWIGQISRDIGIKLSTKSPTLTTHIIDPEVDLAREYLLHSLLAEGLVAQFGFVNGSKFAPREQPATNLTGDPYFSDGMRLVILVASDPLPLVEVHSLEWEQSAAPVAEGQTEQAKRHVRPIEVESPRR